MSIFYGISNLRKLSETRSDADRIGEVGTSSSNPWVLGGFWLICILAAVSMVLLRLFSVGIESFGIMVSAIVYYSFLQAPDSSEAHTALFAQLLVADTLGLFLDEVAWLVQGRAGFAAANVIANTLLR